MKQLLISIIAIFLIGFITAGVTYSNTTIDQAATQLITKRINILNQYYKGYIDYDRTYDKLKKVEEGSLLNDDNNNMSTYCNTSFDIVKDFDIKLENIQENKFGFITGQVFITWILVGNNSTYYEKRKYSFICKKENDNFKLIKFEIM